MKHSKQVLYIFEYRKMEEILVLARFKGFKV